MIVDNLENLELYFALNNKLKIISEYMQNNDLLAMEVGKYKIDGDDLYLSLQEYISKSESVAKPELHREYIDLQLVVSGIEKIGYADNKNITAHYDYDESKDLQFVDSNVEFIEAVPNKFFIFYPQDLHMPSIAINEPQKVKKAVFKIKI